MLFRSEEAGELDGPPGDGEGGGSEVRMSPSPGSKDDPRFCVDLRVESSRMAKAKEPLPEVSPRWRPPVVLLATDATTTPKKLTWQEEYVRGEAPLLPSMFHYAATRSADRFPEVATIVLRVLGVRRLQESIRSPRPCRRPG